MAPRPVSHRPLVNAIIDADLEASKIVDDVEKSAPDLASKLKAIARVLVELGAKGRITPAAAKAIWREKWTALHLAAFAKVAERVLEHASETTAAEFAHARSLGGDVTMVTAIKSADVIAREVERAAPPIPGA